MTRELTDEQAAGLFELGAVVVWGSLGWVATGDMGVAWAAAATAAITLMAIHRVISVEVGRVARREEA